MNTGQVVEDRNFARFRAMLRIRRFEEKVLEMFPRGVFYGTTHTYLGQEANAVGVLSQIEAGDIVFSNHRCHGHFLAYGGDMRALFAELMGKSTGVCAGRGGSQHLHWKNFYSNGIQGGIVPAAAGMALAEKLKHSSAVTVVFLGDGTLGEGVVYEAFNMASLWKLPLLIVIENNRIAQTTPIELALAGDIRKRLAAFDIPCQELETQDAAEIEAVASRLIRDIRAEASPRGLLLHCHRFGPHSKGDDPRPAEEISRLYREHDPLEAAAARLPATALGAVRLAVEKEVEAAYAAALQDPFPEPQVGVPG